VISQQLRQIGILGGLGTVLGTILYVQGSGGANPGAVTNTPAAAGNTTTPLAASPVADVRLDALQASRGETPESERNPFRFRPRAVEGPVGGARGAGGRAAAPPPPPPVMPVAPPQPQGPPPPPPIALRFIGIVDPAASDARAAIFSDMRGNVFSGREGDIIEGRYRVMRVGADAAELAYLDGRGRQTIRLSGQ